MSNDARRPRDELADRLAAGDADITTLIATVLISEVLPALDQISKEIAGINVQIAEVYRRTAMVEMTLCEIDAIYENLQHWCRSERLARDRVDFSRRLRGAVQKLELVAREKLKRTKQ